VFLKSGIIVQRGNSGNHIGNLEFGSDQPSLFEYFAKISLLLNEHPDEQNLIFNLQNAQNFC
jgi:hypothetical protein